MRPPEVLRSALVVLDAFIAPSKKCSFEEVSRRPRSARRVPRRRAVTVDVRPPPPTGAAERAVSRRTPAVNIGNSRHFFQNLHMQSPKKRGVRVAVAALIVAAALPVAHGAQAA